eukprot:TRINITY_DN65566_c0_g1_i1.p1 TRINITY_DN65566_c0_g1~~TRINITY_DN65566_c0_g1_i1.p1  ORF type:complete len:312 (+),score=79.82 TRINITY_DN65566_c0_g1_i1:73-1008(+)
MGRSPATDMPRLMTAGDSEMDASTQLDRDGLSFSVRRALYCQASLAHAHGMYKPFASPAAILLPLQVRRSFQQVVADDTVHGVARVLAKQIVENAMAALRTSSEKLVGSEVEIATTVATEDAEVATDLLSFPGSPAATEASLQAEADFANFEEPQFKATGHPPCMLLPLTSTCAEGEQGLSKEAAEARAIAEEEQFVSKKEAAEKQAVVEEEQRLAREASEDQHRAEEERRAKQAADAQARAEEKRRLAAQVELAKKAFEEFDAQAKASKEQLLATNAGLFQRLLVTLSSFFRCARRAVPNSQPPCAEDMV